MDVQVLELGMQCLRHRHMEITRDLQTGGSGKFDIQLWRVTHEKVSIFFLLCDKACECEFFLSTHEKLAAMWQPDGDPIDMGPDCDSNCTLPC